MGEEISEECCPSSESGLLVSEGTLFCWHYLTKSNPLPGGGASLLPDPRAVAGVQRSSLATSSVHPDGVSRPSPANLLGMGTKDLHVMSVFLKISTIFRLHVLVIPASLSWPTYRFTL